MAFCLLFIGIGFLVFSKNQYFFWKFSCKICWNESKRKRCISQIKPLQFEEKNPYNFSAKKKLAICTFWPPCSFSAVYQIKIKIICRWRKGQYQECISISTIKELPPMTDQPKKNWYLVHKGRTCFKLSGQFFVVLKVWSFNITNFLLSVYREGGGV